MLRKKGFLGFRSALKELLSLLDESSAMPHNEFLQAELTDAIVETRYRITEEKNNLNVKCFS